MGYLSKNERTNYLISIGAMEVLNIWANDERSHMTKTVKKNLRSAKTYIEKALKEIVAGLEPEYTDRLMRDAKNNYLSITPVTATTPKDERRVNTESLYDLGAFALIMCQKEEECYMKDNDWKDCELYKAMVDLTIPVANFDGNRCPYKL